MPSPLGSNSPPWCRRTTVDLRLFCAGSTSVGLTVYGYTPIPTYLGEISGTGSVADAGEIQYYHPPAKWEGGYKGPRFIMEYPLADEYGMNTPYKKGEPR